MTVVAISILSFGSIIFVLFTGDKLYRLYKHKFLALYQYYLIAYVLGGITLISGVTIAANIFPIESSSFVILQDFLLIFGFPLLAVIFYLLFRFLQEWLQERVSTAFTVTYWGIWTPLTVVYLTGVWAFPEPLLEDLTWCVLPSAGSWIYKAGIYISLLYFIFRAGKKQDPLVRKGMRSIGIYYVLAYFVLHINTMGMKSLIGSTIVYFGLQIPAVLMMKRHLRRLYGESLSLAVDDEQLVLFLSKFAVSKREEEIIRLILEGKSNRDIEKELFISGHTVKNHIYNIYKKIGINNRIHLIQAIRNGH